MRVSGNLAYGIYLQHSLFIFEVLYLLSVSTLNLSVFRTLKSKFS
jgi:hypothetical protein